MKLVTVAEMRNIEKQAAESGLSYEQMMENAGRGLAQTVLKLTEGMEIQPVALGLVGSGNNGGDTLVALFHLAQAGWEVQAYIVGDRPKKDVNCERLLSEGGTILYATKDTDFSELDERLEDADVLLDGVLGTGLKLPIKLEVGAVLAHVAQFDDLPLVVAVDCPSGVDCETGECAAETIPADFTVCMAAVKTGLLRLPAHLLTGQILTVEIGLPDDLVAWRSIRRFVASPKVIRDSLPGRPADAHKGSFGCAVIAAGSINYTGAALLAGKAAYQVGAGLVRMAIPSPLHAVLAGHLPEATWVILPHELGAISVPAAPVLLKNLEKATTLLIGPGLGTEDTTADFMRKLLSGDSAHSGRSSMGFFPVNKDEPGANAVVLPPLVVDADGLRLLGQIDDWWKMLPEQSILTPHPGEMAFLTGLKIEQVQADRVEVAVKYAAQWNCVVVLKGAFTVVANPKGEATVVPVATSALAKAGTGDVLAGMVTGLVAQNMAAYPAAVAAAWLHAQAGLQVEAGLGSAVGVMASDILSALPAIFGRLSEK